MTRDDLLQAEEQIMEAVCGLCHWPYVYRDEETMYTEKCDFCPAAAVTLTELEKAASSHPTADNQIIPPKEG